VTSKLIYDNLAVGVEKHLIEKKDVLAFVKQHDTDVLVILGAGNLDNDVPQIAQIINQKP
jgi:UDP-N-acetylmuramate--L-alanine ligase